MKLPNGNSKYMNLQSEDRITKQINLMNFYRERGGNQHPTIIINCAHFIKIIGNIDDSVIVGGSYRVYNEKIKGFFEELKKCNTNLVFFCRPFINGMKEHWIHGAFDSVIKNDSRSLQALRNDIYSKQGNNFPWHLDKRFLYNLMKIALEYGTVIVEQTDCSSKITKYAHDHSDEVLAMIQHDTDFLLFEGQYQYWSLGDLDISALTTMKFCSNALYRRLGLNTRQCHMLSAISRLKGDAIHRFLEKLATTERKHRKMFKLANYVRTIEIGPNGYDLHSIASNIYGEIDMQSGLETIEYQFSRYNKPIVNELDECHPKLLEIAEFCKRNLYFAYGLILDAESTNEALAYIDLRKRFATDFINFVVNVILKLYGILYKDFEITERPQTRKIFIKRTFNEDAVKRDEFIDYPTSMSSS